MGEAGNEYNILGRIREGVSAKEDGAGQRTGDIARGR